MPAFDSKQSLSVNDLRDAHPPAKSKPPILDLLSTQGHKDERDLLSLNC